MQDEHYFDHEADIGIIGRGKTIDDAFTDAAIAIFGLMCDLNEVRGSKRIDFKFEESDPEMAFVTWLNLLIGLARKNGLIFSQFECSHHNQIWHGVAWGEPWKEQYTRGVEVKGATLTELSVCQSNDIWEARCVVDV